MRDFSWENDVNDGIDGILNSLSTFEEKAFICGSPETLLDLALLWLPSGPFVREANTKMEKSFPAGHGQAGSDWSFTQATYRLQKTCMSKLLTGKLKCRLGHMSYSLTPITSQQAIQMSPGIRRRAT